MKNPVQTRSMSEKKNFLGYILPKLSSFFLLYLYYFDFMGSKITIKLILKFKLSVYLNYEIIQLLKKQSKKMG